MLLWRSSLQVSQELTKDFPHIFVTAGACLLCYYMKINIDPVKEKITLSRFMHKKDNQFQILILIPANDRDYIYQKIFTRWKDKVRISNHIKYKEKSAFREAIRQEGYNKFVPRNYNLIFLMIKKK